MDTPCVQIDIDPLELGRSYPNTVGLMGDPQATLAKLLTALGKPARDTAFADRAARIVAAWREARAPLLANDAVPIFPDRLCARRQTFRNSGQEPGQLLRSRARWVLIRADVGQTYMDRPSGHRVSASSPSGSGQRGVRGGSVCVPIHYD
jgi:thiamine pyrophosphate-dependent acetolactate synthase large subunit-like protein